jgi:hypothetical protein
MKPYYKHIKKKKKKKQQQQKPKFFSLLHAIAQLMYKNNRHTYFVSYKEYELWPIKPIEPTLVDYLWKNEHEKYLPLHPLRAVYV